MNDLATIIKNNSPKAAKQTQANARKLNTMGASCSGRLAETTPKNAATRAYLRKHGRP